MSLLVVADVAKRFPHPGRERPDHVALRDVSFEVAPAELVAVWGRRRSGRSTLLHVAGGVEAPSAGVVRFAGRDLRRHPMLGRPGGIGYCTTTFTRVVGETVLEHVSAPLLGTGSSVVRAQAQGLEALRRVGAAGCTELEPAELDHDEAIRIGVARALVTRPRLLLLDEPTGGGAPAHRRDALLALMRSIADEDGIAVLATVGEGADLAGADRALTIHSGEVRGETSTISAEVIPLRLGVGVRG